MARKKQRDTSEIDAWIDKAASPSHQGCPLCYPKTKGELDKIEARLRAKKKRVPVKALWRRLTELELIDFGDKAFSSRLQKPCHIKLYKYLRGLE